MPGITRRRLLAGSAVVIGGGYGGYRLVQDAPDANLASWTPETGTWPLKHYDPANTAHNPHAAPPREKPEKRELASVAYDGEQPIHLDPLAGPDHLAVYGDTLAAVGESGTVTHQEPEAQYAGFHPDGHLYAVRRGRSDSTLAVYDGMEEAHRYPVPGNPEGLTIGREEVYVSINHRGVVAYERESGRNWDCQGEGTALSDGHLYTVEGNDGMLAYREREPPERWVSAGPERVWTGPDVGHSIQPPAVSDGRLIIGTNGFGEHRSTLTALDAETGDLLWEPKSFGDEIGDWVTTPAVAGRDGYVTVHFDDSREDFVARYDLETGEEIWRDDTGLITYNPALGGDQTLVVAGEVQTGNGTPSQMVRAYDAESGDELWTVTFPGGKSTGLALVGDRVLATYGTSLYELV